MEGTCGAISAAAVLAGLKISTADLEKPNSKGTSYKASKACIAAFKEKNSTIVCRELKGVDTGKVLRACPDCIRDSGCHYRREPVSRRVSSPKQLKTQQNKHEKGKPVLIASLF